MKLTTLIPAAILVLMTVFGAYAASSNPPKTCPALNLSQTCEL